MTQPTDIIIPPEVQALFDRADFDDNQFAAVIGEDSIELTSVDRSVVHARVAWPEAGAYGRRLLAHAKDLAARLDAERQALLNGQSVAVVTEPSQP